MSNDKYFRACARVDLKAIRQNVITAKEELGGKTGIIAVIKTDAYGHGALKVAHAISDLVEGYAVATVDEAVELRDDGIDKHILILGYVSPSEYAKAINADAIIPVFTYEQARTLSEAAALTNKKGLCHIKLDTGMNRIGFAAKCDEDIADTVEEIKRVKALDNIVCDGIFTHFASSDCSDKTKANKQYDRFVKVVDLLKESGVTFTYHHCANSAAIMDMPQDKFEWARQGITLYGLKPSDEVGGTDRLIPAMSLLSHVVHIKKVRKGEEVSYGGIYVADSDRTLATISIGYGDGYPRSLSNKGYVLIHGKKAPIVGRVCMDQFMVDISNIEDVNIEDVVTLIGRDGDKSITFEEMGELSGRFNYEFVCELNKRVKRIYTN